MTESKTTRPEQTEETHHVIRVKNVNARSMRNKMQQIEAVLREERVDIAAFQETWLFDADDETKAQDHIPNVPGYKWYGKTRDSKTRGGGVGFLISDRIGFQPVQIEMPDSAIETATIAVSVRGAPRIHFTAVYVPPRKAVDFSILARLPLARTVMLADVNAHHKTWSQGRENQRGRALYAFIRRHGVSAMDFLDTPTYLSSEGNPSSPDLILAGREVAPFVRNWRLSAGIGSDHTPQSCELHIAHTRVRKHMRKQYKWRYSTLDTEKYMRRLSELFAEWQERHPLEGMDVNRASTEWVEHTLKACEDSCQRYRDRGQNGVPWMTSEIKSDIREREKARKRYTADQTEENWREWCRLKTMVKTKVRRAKAEQHKRFCRSFTKENAHNKLKHAQPRPSLPDAVETGEGNTLTDDRAIADELCETFSQAGAPGEQKLPEWQGPAPKTDRQEYMSDISLAEVETVLQRLKMHKAPGRDGIRPWMLKHGGDVMAKAVRHLLQGCWRAGETPAAWKFADIRPIMKKTAAKTPTDFRPISLLPVISKIYDSVILARLQSVSDSAGWVPEYQAGFRTHRSALEHLIRLQQEGHTAFARKEFLVVAFLDISKAYDCVSRPLLLQKLKGLGVDGNMLHYLAQFLGRRFACVSYRGERSHMTEFQYGVPQGSPISPLLFNIYCAEALHRCGGGRGLQADDMCVWRRHSSQLAACRLLSRDLSKVHSWGDSHLMRFSVSKCKVVIITRKRRPKHPFVFFGGKVLEVVKHHKYLGVVIDQTLCWKDHISYVRKRASTKFAIIKRLCSKRAGVVQPLLLLLYKTCVRPVLEYASEVWGDLSNTRAKALDTVQHHALTASLGANRISHKWDTCVEAQVEPLAVRRDVQLLRFWKTIHQHTRPLTRYLELLPHSDRLRREGHRSSYLERVQSLIARSGIPENRAQRLTKQQIGTLTTNLWRRHRRDKLQIDLRSRVYRQIQTSTKLEVPATYNTTEREFCARWHELRLGTAPLSCFLHSIGKSEDRNCECSPIPESVQHFVLHCPRFSRARRRMFSKLRQTHMFENIPTLPQVLSPDNVSFEAVTQFLIETRRLADV